MKIGSGSARDSGRRKLESEGRRWDDWRRQI